MRKLSDMGADELEAIVRKVVTENADYLSIKSVSKMMDLKSRISTLKRLNEIGVKKTKIGTLVRYSKKDIQEAIERSNKSELTKYNSEEDVID